MKPSEAWKVVRGNDDASKLSTAAVDANSEADGEPKETLDSQSAAQESRSTVGIQSKSEALIAQLGEEADSTAAYEEYNRVYNQKLRLYNSGYYGEVGSKDAVEALEKDLAKDRKKVKAKFGKGGEDDGEN